jgi:hypothetical protein
MVDQSRRAALKLTGGGMLAGLLAPFALKTGAAAKPAFVPPMPSGPGGLLGRPSGLLGSAKHLAMLKKSHALQDLASMLYERQEKRGRHVKLDPDIETLVSVQPWAKVRMQLAREEETKTLLDKVHKLIRGLSDEKSAGIDQPPMPGWSDG